MSMQIEVWACPMPGCGSHYAAPGAGNMAEAKNIRSSMQNKVNDPLAGSVTGTRDECPLCKVRGTKLLDGKPIRRQRLLINVDVPIPPEVRALLDRTEAVAG